MKWSKLFVIGANPNVERVDNLCFIEMMIYMRPLVEYGIESD